MDKKDEEEKEEEAAARVVLWNWFGHLKKRRRESISFVNWEHFQC